MSVKEYLPDTRFNRGLGVGWRRPRNRRLLFEVFEHRLALSATEWRIADGGNGHFYEQVIGPTAIDWATANARAAAKSLDGVSGHLVTITSAPEQAFVASLFDGQRTWIGMTDDPAFGGTESFGTQNPQTDGWVWVTGEPFAYENWYNDNEPNNSDNSGRPENFGMMDNGAVVGGWNDVPSGVAQWNFARYLVEFDVPVLFHNRERPSDVDDDTVLSANDVLAIINRINANGSGVLPTHGPVGAYFYDVNGDRSVAADDVILVINEINAVKTNFNLESESGEMPASIIGVESEQVLSDEVVELLALDGAQTKARRTTGRLWNQFAKVDSYGSFGKKCLIG